MRWTRQMAGVALVMGMSLAGCALKGGPGGAAAAGDYWRIRPVAMRVYPSSGFVQRDGRHLIEARVELLDETGDAVKGVGHFRFELTAGEGPGQIMIGRVLESWDLAMLSLEQNRAHYDSVTRTYRFRLGLTHPPPRDQVLQLVVTLTPPQGGRIEARAVIGGAGPGS